MKKEDFYFQMKICNRKVVNNHVGTYFFTKHQENCKTENHLGQKMNLTSLVSCLLSPVSKIRRSIEICCPYHALRTDQILG